MWKVFCSYETSWSSKGGIVSCSVFLSGLKWPIIYSRVVIVSTLMDTFRAVSNDDRKPANRTWSELAGAVLGSREDGPGSGGAGGG